MKNYKTSKTERINTEKVSIKIVIVLAALIIFGLVTGITMRAEYLNFSGIGEKYISVFEQKVINKCNIFIE